LKQGNFILDFHPSVTSLVVDELQAGGKSDLNSAELPLKDNYIHLSVKMSKKDIYIDYRF